MEQQLKVKKGELETIIKSNNDLKKEKEEKQKELLDKVNIKEINNLSEKIKEAKEKLKELEKEKKDLEKVKKTHEKCLKERENINNNITQLKKK